MEKYLSKYTIFIFIFVLFVLGSCTVQSRSFNYSSNSSSSPCISLDINFTIQFTAFNNTFTIDPEKMTHDDVVNVSGSCAPALITLSLSNGANWSFHFSEDKNRDVHLERTIQYIPNEIFNNRHVNDPDLISIQEERLIKLFKAPFSYQCNREENKHYSNESSNHNGLHYTVNVSVFNVHLQGFGAHNGEPITTVVCASDGNNGTFDEIANTTDTSNQTSETTSAWKTTPTATTSLPEVPVNSFIVSENNINCILLEGAFTIMIDYLTNDSSPKKPKTKTASINIPANSTGTGNCNQTATSQNLLISFFDGWSVDIVFTLNKYKISDAKDSSDIDYSITNVTLIYLKNETLFPGAQNQTDTPIIVIPGSKDLDYAEKSANYDYYKCNSKIEMKLEDGVTIQTTDLVFKAFNTNNETRISGDADECAADVKTSQVVPIAVACTLGGLTLTVAVVYVIGRIRKRD